MPKVSMELYIDDVADNCYTAIISKDKLDAIRREFANAAEDILFAKELDDA